MLADDMKVVHELAMNCKNRSIFEAWLRIKTALVEARNIQSKENEDDKENKPC